jgi:NAD+ kinase
MAPRKSTTPNSVSFDPKSVRRVGIVAALHKRRIAAAVQEVTEWLSSRGLRVLVPEDQAAALSLPELAIDRSQIAESVDLLLAMGGDGTLLATARMGAPCGKTILGINLGGFGFLAAIPRAGMLDALDEVWAGRLRVEERMMLAARVFRDGGETASFIALNDIVVGKGAFSRLFRLKTSISGEPISDFPADGMIVATPTGSTGYSLSAGGPVIDPEVCVFIVTPICAHALSARARVVPATHVVEMLLPDPRGEEVYLTADGQEGVSLRAGDRVEVRQAPFSARLIQLEDASFYSRLRSKLGWGASR